MNNKQHHLDILTEAFFDNKSVNFSIKQDKRKRNRIKAMMQYAYGLRELYGKVILSECNNGIALINFPQEKKTSFKSIGMDFKLVSKSIGFRNVLKVLRRESKIKMHHPKSPYIYFS